MQSNRRHQRERIVATACVGAVALAASLWISWWQWQTLSTPSWDLGIFTQLAAAYAHGSAPIVEIKGPNYNLLGDHFHPILILLGPLYRLAPSPLTLLVTQDVLFSLSAAALTWRTWHLTARWVAVICGVILAVGWPTQTAVASQFHEIAFAVPLVTFALTSYLARRYRQAAWWMAGLVFVKEDLGLTVAVFGCILLWRWWHIRDTPAGPPLRRTALATLMWGIIWFVLTVTVILPAFNPTGGYDYTDRLTGASVLTFFTPATKLVLLGLLAVTAGLIGLTSPLIMLVLPTMAWRFAGNVEFYWWIGWHYDVILLPILLIALIDATSMHSLTARLLPTKRYALRRLGVLLASASSLLVITDLPLITMTPHELTASSAIQRRAASDAIHAHIAALTTADGSEVQVAADATMLARLVDVADVCWAGDSRFTPDVVVLDDYWSGRGAPIDSAARAQADYGVEYREIYHAAGLRVAERVVH
ncbi:MAG: DUF2079 domain-containing protein [Bowdeniella nasicola]|nr:DUF2079 domain-containing protein [Bowdeniella nasicola]